MDNQFPRGVWDALQTLKATKRKEPTQQHVARQPIDWDARIAKRRQEAAQYCDVVAGEHKRELTPMVDHDGKTRWID